MAKTTKVTDGICYMCTNACPTTVQVRDDKIVKIDIADPKVAHCPRWKAQTDFIYHPDRLLYPLKRTGERGEGKFERISWDEALDILAGELNRVRETYGPAAILFKWSGGDTSVLHNAMCHYKVLNMIGGCSDVWGTFSFDGGLFADLATYGTVDTGNTRDDLLNSRLIVMWGWNPSVTIQNTNTAWYLARAREAGIRIVSVDPRYTESNA